MQIPSSAMNSSSDFPSFPSQNPNPDCPPSLSTTISSLTSRLFLSSQTLNSHSTLFQSLNPNLVPCPFSPNHHLLPECFFSHSLHCSSPAQTLDLYPPNYRNTLKPLPIYIPWRPSYKVNTKQSSELCLSLDDYFSDFGSNFFYKDCPGVVNLFDVDNSKKTFTLPWFLSVECVDFESFNEGESNVGEKMGLRVLASGLREIRTEIERWDDYPVSYSFNVVCRILGSRMVKGSSLRKWMVANSPRYGVLIDEYMGYHIVLLVRLCLKAAVREAVGLVEVGMEYGESKEKELDLTLRRRMFDRPVFLQVLMWLEVLSFLFCMVN